MIDAPGVHEISRPAQGSLVRDRITWVARSDGAAHQIWDVSDDDGRTRGNTFTGI